MLTYLLLMKATPEGIRKISDIDDRYEAFRKTLKKEGGRLVGAWALLGEHDYAAVVELPSEKDLVRLSLSVGARGGSTVQSFRAIPMEEFVEIARKL